ncbi:hypothetical protein [Micromonospora sp. NPDC050200]|uniref:hypothetical protein n=1 Tax=Micromonospora sp. NPDC050200 TaxID=3155664 RepID=UPI0033CE6B0B
MATLRRAAHPPPLRDDADHARGLRWMHATAASTPDAPVVDVTDSSGAAGPSVGVDWWARPANRRPGPTDATVAGPAEPAA